jgi:hypothetical protein
MSASMTLSFSSFAEMADHAKAIDWAMTRGAQAGIQNTVIALHHLTRAKFGVYQVGHGPFQTWPELSEFTKFRRGQLGFSENEPLLRTGALRDSYRWAAEGMKGGVGSDSIYAETQEIGDPFRNIPARSTLGLAFSESEKQLFSVFCRTFERAFIDRIPDYGSVPTMAMDFVE